MKYLPIASALLVSATALFAQEKAAPQMPDPKHKEHEALAPLAGDWSVTMKVAAMPGVPNMEKPSESKATEHVEMLCNGLWLKSSISGTYQNAPFEGIWLAGYDPFKKEYSSYWISNDPGECGLSTMTGSYDAAKKTWTWSGESSMGPMRSVFVLESNDRAVETCYLKGKDGKETQCMEIVRTRGKSPVAAEASASKPAPLAKEHEMLQRDVGTWDAVVKCAMPGQPETTEPGAETVTSTCCGVWLWTNFQGSMGGKPFEGHGILGYDTKAKKYVGIWIDSMSATAAVTNGTFNDATKSLSLAGECTCPVGKPMTMTETLTWKGDDTKVAQMKFTTEGQTSTMQIDYKRKAPKR